MDGMRLEHQILGLGSFVQIDQVIPKKPQRYLTALYRWDSQQRPVQFNIGYCRCRQGHDRYRYSPK